MAKKYYSDTVELDSFSANATSAITASLNDTKMTQEAVTSFVEGGDSQLKGSWWQGLKQKWGGINNKMTEEQKLAVELQDAITEASDMIKNYMAPDEYLDTSQLPALQSELTAAQNAIAELQEAIAATKTVYEYNEKGECTGSHEEPLYDEATREYMQNQIDQVYQPIVDECNRLIEKIQGLEAVMQEAQKIIDAVCNKIEQFGYSLDAILADNILLYNGSSSERGITDFRINPTTGESEVRKINPTTGKAEWVSVGSAEAKNWAGIRNDDIIDDDGIVWHHVDFNSVSRKSILPSLLSGNNKDNHTRLYVNSNGEFKTFVERENPLSGQNQWVPGDSKEAATWSRALERDEMRTKDGTLWHVDDQSNMHLMDHKDKYGNKITMFENEDGVKQGFVPKIDPHTGNTMWVPAGSDEARDWETPKFKFTPYTGSEVERVLLNGVDYKTNALVSENTTGQIRTEADKIYNYFKGKGYNDAAIAGVFATFFDASYKNGDINPQAVGDGGTSYGYVQWHKTMYNTSDHGLVNWCNENGYDYTTTEGQIAFMEHTLQTSYSNVDNILSGVDDSVEGARKAAINFAGLYARPASEARRYGRRDTAQYIYNQLENGEDINSALAGLRQAQKEGRLLDKPTPKVTNQDTSVGNTSDNSVAPLNGVGENSTNVNKKMGVADAVVKSGEYAIKGAINSKNNSNQNVAQTNKGKGVVDGIVKSGVDAATAAVGGNYNQPQTSTQTTTQSQLSGDTNYSKAYNYLKGQGYGDAAVSGMLANFYSESFKNGDINPNAVGDGGTSHGIAQWHKGAGDRMVEWCNNNGYDSHSIDGQVAYFAYDLKNNYPELDSYLRNTGNTLNDARNAGSRIGLVYERPANEWGASGRGNISQYIMHQLQDGASLDQAMSTISDARSKGQLK